MLFKFVIPMAAKTCTDLFSANSDLTFLYTGSVQIGISKNPTIQSDLVEISSSSVAVPAENNTKATKASMIPRRKTATDKYETDETKNLTTKELQRLVLLQQFQTATLQKEYYQKRLQKLQSENDNIHQQTGDTFLDNITVDGDTSYYNLN